MNDWSTADSRALVQPMCDRLLTIGPRATFEWLAALLATQSPGLRSSNAHLVAYTGRLEALDWLEGAVDSPVTENWGNAAALLGATWPKIMEWFRHGGARQLMALDALLAYRAPSPNMAPLAQIAAPALRDPPPLAELVLALDAVVRERDTPRTRRAASTIIERASEILSPRERAVPVAELPRLFVEPETFPGARAVLMRHEVVTAAASKFVRDVLGERGSEE